MKSIIALFIIVVLIPNINAQKQKLIVKEFPYGELLRIEYYVLKKNKYVKHGLYKSIYRNGLTKEIGEYRNNKRIGEWKEYNKRNELIRTQEFIEDRLIQDKKIGVWKEYDDDGIPFFFDYDRMKRIKPQIPYFITYPSKERDSNISGTVKVKISLNEDCELSEIKIIKSLGPSFDDEVEKGIVESVKYLKEYKKDCVNYRDTLLIDFKLK